MKKIFTILALAMISAVVLAEVKITVTPNVIDFGTIELDENGEANCSDWAEATLDYTLGQWVYNVNLDTISTVNPACDVQVVSDRGYDFWYMDGYNVKETAVWVWFYAIEAGDYEMKYRFWAWSDYDETSKYEGPEFTVKAKVVAKGATNVENVETSVKAKKIVRNGQVYILRNGELYNAIGAKVE